MQCLRKGVLGGRSRYSYVFPFSLSGSPVVVLPVGFDPDLGLPIGIQIVGPNWKEGRILALAKVLESKLAGWRRAIPDVLTADFENGVRVSRA